MVRRDPQLRPNRLRRQVTFFENIVLQHGSGDREVDHLIPLKLGGSNSIKNL
jgi:5-methylcytosine-specific restriction endonuclease McrA